MKVHLVSTESDDIVGQSILEQGNMRAKRSDARTVRVEMVPLLPREQRLADLRKGRHWDRVVRQQVESTFKGLSEESPGDLY